MRQTDENRPISQAVNEEEIEQTAPLREFFCEPSGCGLFDTVGSEISEYVGGLREPFCTGHKVQASPMASYFE